MVEDVLTERGGASPEGRPWKADGVLLGMLGGQWKVSRRRMVEAEEG